MGYSREVCAKEFYCASTEQKHMTKYNPHILKTCHQHPKPAEFTYRSAHNPVMVRRLEWFERPSEPYLALWWIPTGHIPDLNEAAERLAQLREHGPSQHAFTLKERFDPPSTAGEAAAG